MRFSLLITGSLLAALATSRAVDKPLPEKSGVAIRDSVSKRANAYADEVVFIAQCSMEGHGYTEYSYYSNYTIEQSVDPRTLRPLFPDDEAFITYTSQATLEGHTYNAQFMKSLANFTATINSNAKSLKIGAVAGYGSNSFGTGFTCYQAGGGTLFQVSLLECFAMYSCSHDGYHSNPW
jgi:hypothetical protein